MVRATELSADRRERQFRRGRRCLYDQRHPDHLPGDRIGPISLDDVHRLSCPVRYK